MNAKVSINKESWANPFGIALLVYYLALVNTSIAPACVPQIRCHRC